MAQLILTMMVQPKLKPSQIGNPTFEPASRSRSKANRNTSAKVWPPTSAEHQSMQIRLGYLQASGIWIRTIVIIPLTQQAQPWLKHSRPVNS